MVNTARRLRFRGAALNTKSIIALAKHTVRTVRGRGLFFSLLNTKAIFDVPTDLDMHLGKHWVRSWRRRCKMSGLRHPTTDRQKSSRQQLEADNVWRQVFAQVVANPKPFGVRVPDGAPASIPDAMQIAMDETPLPYCAVGKRTFTVSDTKQITIITIRP